MAKSIAAKLNTLESVIVRGEDSVEDARWGQAREVVRLIDAGHTQRQIAAEWVNGRTDKSYSAMHVNRVAQIWRRFGVTLGLQDQPSWGDAFQTVKEGADEIIDTGQRWKEMVESRPPTSRKSAQRFVEKLVASGNDGIMATISDGIDSARVERAQARHSEGRSEPTARSLMGDEQFDPSESWADTLIVRVANNMHLLDAHVRKWGLVLGSMTEDDAYEYLLGIERLAAEHRAAIQERISDKTGATR